MNCVPIRMAARSHSGISPEGERPVASKFPSIANSLAKGPALTADVPRSAAVVGPSPPVADALAYSTCRIGATQEGRAAKPGVPINLKPSSGSVRTG
ncbi:hypothetical protein BJX62DRAFT_220866 [Aspergillus germanicus]